MSKIVKNSSSSQSLNVIHIKNIFINPNLKIHKKTNQPFPPIHEGNFHHSYKPILHSRKYPNYEIYCKRIDEIDSDLSALKEKLAKALHSKWKKKSKRK